MTTKKTAKVAPLRAPAPAKKTTPKAATPAGHALLERAQTQVAKAEARKPKAKEPPAAKAPSKQDKLIHALRSKAGTTVGEAGKHLGWQDHTVRGALFGALKRKGLIVTKETVEGRGTVYRLPLA